MKLLSFLFPYNNDSTAMSAVLLILRLLFGGLMLWHGISKIENFETLADNFPNPIGLGSRVSLCLAIFAEVFCSVGVIVGAFFRLALIPLIFTMCVALFVVHNGQSFAAKELATIFFVIYVMLFLVGAGRWSFDNIIAVRLYEERTAIATTIVEEAIAHRQQDSEHPTDGEPRQ